jgi:PEP-CTERM motif
MKKVLFLTIMIGILFAAVSGVYATTIMYDLSNLGGNHWEYTYSVTNDSMSSTIEEFTIYFNLDFYKNLPVTSSIAGWDELVVQPDPALGDGFYDALALMTGIAQGATLSGFSVSFDWLGTGSPGSQYFEVIFPFSSPVEVLEQGYTMASATPVPEPGTLLLLGSGLISLIGIGKRLKIKA